VIDESGLKKILEGLTGRPLILVFTENRTTLLSIRKAVDGVTIRVHRVFLSAGIDIFLEIADFITKGHCNSRLLRAFFREKRPALKQKRSVTARIRPEGKAYCLKSIYEKVNSEYFDGAISACITWGRINPKQSVKMRTLGSYNFETNTIRINPLLDRKTVPLYFIEFVVYHEMLHALLGIKKKNGRRSVHSKEFRLYEKKFNEYSKALEWERARFSLKH
jgi:predicted SprT family Zn-dependent metalloprotease